MAAFLVTIFLLAAFLLGAFLLAAFGAAAFLLVALGAAPFLRAVFVTALRFGLATLRVVLVAWRFEFAPGCRLLSFCSAAPSEFSFRARASAGSTNAMKGIHHQIISTSHHEDFMLIAGAMHRPPLCLLGRRAN